MSSHPWTKKLAANDPYLHVKTPRCPLCHDMMNREFRPKRDIYVFNCPKPACNISIWVGDQFVGRWEEALKNEKIPCLNPRCPKAPDGEMRYFATRTGYMKAVCPTCGGAMTNMEPDKKQVAPDKVYTPDDRGTVQ